MNLSRTIFWVSTLTLVFLVASLMGYYRMITYDLILKPIQESLKTADQLIRGKPDLIQAVKYEREGVTVYQKHELQGKGLTAMQGWFSDGVQVKLMDYQGNRLNTWPIDFYAIWPEPKHIDEKNLPQTPYNFHSQGMYLYPDGSLLASIQSLGTFKMDRCGKVLWTLDERTHHSIEVDDEGFIWVPVSGSNREVPAKLMLDSKEKQLLHHDQSSGYDHLILKLDPEGKVLQKISVLKSLVEAGIEDRLYDSLYINASVPLHVNDIEIVTDELAKHITRVKKGDLLLSLRQMHMLVILDRSSGELLWYKVGPWVRQHDPEIDAQGNITVYNNRSKQLVFDGEAPYSNILKYYPESDKVEVLYPKSSDKEKQFYSDIMGTHQILGNGNLLVTETRTGRVFEANRQGEIVWEYIERYKQDYAALIESGERYSDDYFGEINWQDCPVQFMQ